ncbi:MAG: DUF4190 domain-containing protein [Phycisphaerales bacterium]|nr:DUF4190 domain-containing protein [Phycisphaerales bacterium]
MNDPLPRDSNQTSRPSVSALAVVAIVLACIPFCPPISALGAILGLIALRRIRDAGGRLKGRRLCITAIIVGLVLSLVTFWAAQRFATWQQAEQEQDMVVILDDFLRTSMAGDSELASTRWSQGTEAVSLEDITLFATSMESTFGAFESVRIGSSQPVQGPSLLAFRVECWVIGRFESGEFNGAARFAMLPSSQQFTLRPLLVELSFEVKDDEPIRIPAVEAVDEQEGG